MPGRRRKTWQPCSSKGSQSPSQFCFQAEDGIRYYKVTGVQTCALPIYLRVKRVAGHVQQVMLVHQHAATRREKIGRASCRERVWISGVAVSLKKQKIGPRVALDRAQTVVLRQPRGPGIPRSL